MRIAILHPGEMGVAVAATLKNSGHEVWWASQGRSAGTERRAAAAGLADAGSLADVCCQCETIFSVCPPEFAESMAREIGGLGFQGLYIDANAISPERARRIGCMMETAGIRFVDACIIGLPARNRGEDVDLLLGTARAGSSSLFGRGTAGGGSARRRGGKGLRIENGIRGAYQGDRGFARRRFGRSQTTRRTARSGEAMGTLRTAHGPSSFLRPARRAQSLAIRSRDARDRRDLRSRRHASGFPSSRGADFRAPCVI